MSYNYETSLALVVIGLVFLVILVFTLRSEISYLSDHRRHRVQLVLSLVSIFVTFLLSLTCLLHCWISPIITFTTLLILGPALLILAPIILFIRARTFTGLIESGLEERRKLIREVKDIIDEKKRQKILDGKIARGEKVDE